MTASQNYFKDLIERIKNQSPRDINNRAGTNFDNNFFSGTFYQKIHICPFCKNVTSRYINQFEDYEDFLIERKRHEKECYQISK